MYVLKVYIIGRQPSSEVQRRDANMIQYQTAPHVLAADILASAVFPVYNLANVETKVFGEDC